jgi:hypothetical protein
MSAMIVEEATLRFAPPQLAAPRLSQFTLTDAAEAFRQLAGSPECELRQGWADEPVPYFRAARVRTAWTKTALIVAAELDDADIFNPATNLNDPGYTLGDVFELFLRPANQEAYYEFHVSPFNQQFQLRIPSAATFKLARVSGIDHWKINTPVFESRTLINAAAQKWWVAAAIPFSLVAERGPVGAGSQWQFSFSRYDYTQGFPKPIISSTSPHPKADFHRQSEWGTLQFVD